MLAREVDLTELFDDGISDEDLIELERIRKSEIVTYNQLFYLFDIQNPYGRTDYDGTCFFG